jgi:hypothetical protein
MTQLKPILKSRYRTYNHCKAHPVSTSLVMLIKKKLYIQIKEKPERTFSLFDWRIQGAPKLYQKLKEIYTTILQLVSDRYPY